MDFLQIKLIIWDLDETLWKGTLSDNNTIYVKDKFVRFIHSALDRGIVHSICSKNSYEETKCFMIEKHLWELFVFPSINWDPKGLRVKQIIEDMKLRPENVLFVDDNLSNLKEALFYCPNLKVCAPDELEKNLDDLLKMKKTDSARPRLQQYRLLEEKRSARDSFSSNEAFLMSCGICVEFHHDCMEQLDRIHELVMRSNQLNYTKFRQKKEDLAESILDKDTDSAYVTVKDNYGDYGIVGFYMVRNDKVVHLLFSCRTLGMKVEQYVYKMIGCPAIEIVGDVVSELSRDFIPPWINQSNAADTVKKEKMRTGNQSVLMKGPCDISQIFSFIEENEAIATEFSYVNDQGILVEGYNHTSQLVTALLAGKDDKACLIHDTPWLDAKMLDAAKWRNSDAVVFSMLTDGNLGIYQHKETGWQIALCEKYYDLTDPANWMDYTQKKIFTSSIPFTEASLEAFSEKYSYVENPDGDVTLSNMDVIYHELRKNSKLILILGSEIPYEKNTNPSYQGRHLYHRNLNDKIRKWAADKENVYLIEISKYIQSQKDFTDGINHFQKKVYFGIAEEISSVLEETKQRITVKGKAFLYFVVIRGKLVKLAKKILGRH